MQTLSRRYVAAVDDLPLRIMSEFDEQPGLRLAVTQVRRLWDLSEDSCRDVLAYLVHSGLLRRDTDGQYCLAGLREGTTGSIDSRGGTSGPRGGTRSPTPRTRTSKRSVRTET